MRKRSAFALVETLMVLGIIALLVSILLPTLAGARRNADAVACAMNQHQLMTAFLMFAADHKGCLPGNYWDSMYQQRNDPEKRDWLLGDNPNQGQAALQYLDGPQNGTVYRYLKNPRIYRCPSYDTGFSLSGGLGSNGRFDYAAFIVFAGARLQHMKAAARFRFTSGPRSGTYDYDVLTPIITEEEPSGGVNGGNVEGGHCNTDRMGHVHRGGANYATLDGSVHWFKEPLDHNAWNWESIAPSDNWTTLGSVVNWGFWDTQ